MSQALSWNISKSQVSSSFESSGIFYALFNTVALRNRLIASGWDWNHVPRSVSEKMSLILT